MTKILSLLIVSVTDGRELATENPLSNLKAYDKE
jgi:hypothetical protein